MAKVTRYDVRSIRIDGARLTREGFLDTEGVVTRSGVFVYHHPDGTVTRERVDTEVLRASMASVKMLPLVNTHAGGKVTTDNVKGRKIGHVGDSVRMDGRDMVAPIRIDTSEGLGAIGDGRLQLSLGYDAEVEEEVGVYHGEPYTHRQVRRDHNHLALVDSARAGKEARLRLDGASNEEEAFTEHADTEDEPENGAHPMKKYTIDGIEYDVPPQIEVHLGKQDAEIKAIKAKADAAEAKADAANEAKAKAEAEAKKAKEDSAADLAKAVTARVALVRSVEDSLDEKTYIEIKDKLDGMSDRDLRVAVIKARNPKFDANGKSDAYVEARFDAEIEAAHEDAVGHQRESMGGGAGARSDAASFGGGVSPERAREDAKKSIASLRTDARSEHFKRRGR